MKGIIIFSILIGIIPNVYSQNKDGLYTREAVEKLLQEGGFSESWKSILLNMAEGIDRGKLIHVGDLTNKIIRNEINFNTLNESVLYGALFMIYTLYTYDPVAGVLKYEGGLFLIEDFDKASEEIRAFYAQVGALSLYLLQWDEYFPKDWVQNVITNSINLNTKLNNYETYNTLYSDIYELIRQTSQDLMNTDLLLEPENKKSNARNQQKRIVANNRRIIENNYGDLIQKYPLSPFPHLIYFKALEGLARWQDYIYLKYRKKIDNLENEEITRILKLEIQKAFDVKEVPLTMFYQTANMNDEDYIEMYQKWLTYFDPGNLLAMGILISELSQKRRFTEAEERLKIARKSLPLVPVGLERGMAYYFALINFAEMTLALYKEDYQRLAAITPKTIELSQDLPIILRKIAGIFSNTPFMQKAGKQVGAKFYLDNFIQGGYKAAKRITEIYPESDYLAADIFNLSFYEFMRLDESDVAYQELVKIAENKLSMGKNTANQVKDLYYRIVKYYTPPGGVPEDVKKYFGVE